MMIKGILYDLLSLFLSIPDLLFPLVNSLPGGPKFFSKGYGNPKIYFARRNYTLKALVDGTYDFDRKEVVELVEEKRGSGIVTFRGQFKSPVANQLPKESQTCYFQLVEPTNHGDKKKKDVYVIMFPATGEMSEGTRLAMAKRLANQHGWSTIILTAPFYGKRKPASQRLFFIDTVTGILLQSEAIIEEGMMLTAWLLNKSPTALVCHSGFSYGAAMASCASAMSLVGGLDGNRIACAPYVGSSSPNVLVDGVLENGVDWKALATSTKKGDDMMMYSGGGGGGGDYKTTRKKIYDLFDESQLNVLANKAAAQRKIAVARAVSFSNDGFIQPKYSMALKSQLDPISSRSVNLKWYPGGHAFAALLRPYLHRRLVEDSVHELIQINSRGQVTK